MLKYIKIILRIVNKDHLEIMLLCINIYLIILCDSRSK